MTSTKRWNVKLLLVLLIAVPLSAATAQEAESIREDMKVIKNTLNKLSQDMQAGHKDHQASIAEVRNAISANATAINALSTQVGNLSASIGQLVKRRPPLAVTCRECADTIKGACAAAGYAQSSDVYGKVEVAVVCFD